MTHRIDGGVERVLVAEFTLDGVEYEAELRNRATGLVEVGAVTNKVCTSTGEILQYEWCGVMSGEWCPNKREVIFRRGDKRLVEIAGRELRVALARGTN